MKRENFPQIGLFRGQKKEREKKDTRGHKQNLEIVLQSSTDYRSLNSLSRKSIEIIFDYFFMVCGGV